MRELQQKQKVKQRLYSTPAIIVLLFFTLVLVRGAYGVVMKERESVVDMNALQNKVVDLSNREFELKHEITSLKTEDGIDKEIKEKFNVAAAGERVAVIVDSSTTATSTTAEQEVWYKHIWNAIISIL